MTDVPQTHWARTVDGACIAYQDLGKGRFLKRLSRNMRVLVFDKRVIGMSDRVAGTPVIGVLADDVRAVIDAADAERVARGLAPPRAGSGIERGGNLIAGSFRRSRKEGR